MNAPAISAARNQYFRVRASTMLLTYIGTFLAMIFLAPLLPDSTRDAVFYIQQKLGPGVLWLGIPAMLLSAAYLVASRIRGTLQIQFAVELGLAAAFFAFCTSQPGP